MEAGGRSADRLDIDVQLGMFVNNFRGADGKRVEQAAGAGGAEAYGFLSGGGAGDEHRRRGQRNQSGCGFDHVKFSLR
jgi:hypothetical protein